MRMGFRLNIEQTQKLIMTTELRQAITILQFSAVELAEYIEEQLLENPCLDIKEEQPEKEEREELTADEEVPVAKEDKFDMDWQEYFADTSDLGFGGQGQGGDRDEVGYDLFLSQAPTLQEHLNFQLQLADLAKNQYAIGDFIIGNIDDHGYLQVKLEEVAQHCRCPQQEAEEVLLVVQGFDPPGVGARNLIECLLLQVAALEIKNPLMEDIIKNHLPELAAGKIQKIAKVLQATLREVQEAVDHLKTLDPKPGRKFSDARDTRYIVPDIVVERVSDEYVVLVNDITVPRLTINRGYKQILAGGEDGEGRKFVEDKLNAASWLIKSIEQRRLTLYKVAQCIVQFQREFLDYGVKGLKPMTLRQVAEVVELHESTVSRATSNKYIQTPQGVFEMKYFFSSGVGSAGGNMVSSESIKKLMKEMVDGEDSGKPLSDQKMADILNEKGINISRRTVAKYREEIRILAAGKRKRY
ncbi:MAG: RNA polymerase factor sigma-54 [Desulfitobacterium hafniense]|nr:RNA polymerase factor sigma-54 [Desulfitobacterium hafniense]